MKLYKDDYVRVDKNGKLAESLDVIYHKSSIDKEEIDNATKCGETFVRMLDLPKELKQLYEKMEITNE
jgi:hypothetical protein|tara:strand:+ start:1999 stop:2202 length:204 start_codon:yes stop_codon:yes gene_type:complete